MKVFDAHSRDIHGNVSVEGTSVLLEFSGLEELICYLKDFYLYLSPAPFEVTGVNVVCFASFTCSQNYGAENVVTVIDGVEEVRVEERYEESGVALNAIELCTARESGIYREGKAKLEKQMENKSKENYGEIKKIETREQRESRLKKKRKSYLNRRKKETEEVKKCRLDKRRESYYIKKKVKQWRKKCLG